MHTNYRFLREPSGAVEPSGLSVPHVIPPVEQQVLRLLMVNYVNGITVAVHREVFEAVGRFDLRFRYGQDYDLWLRISARYRARFLDRPTSVTRLHPNQGTALFTEAGIYDSARAAAAFLDTQPFEALFPALDLTQPDHAAAALMATLQARFQPQAFVTRCGYAPLLEDRLVDWLARAGEPVRASLQGQLRQALPTAGDPAVRALVERLATVPAGGFRFEPREPLALIEAHLARLEREGPALEAAAVQRYLRMIKDTRSTGLEARAS
ncbi:MAG: hypothetical protein QM767_05300 [Anaeromyxobacter sp.]